MGMEWSARFVKYILFAFNLLFVISGIVLIGVGVSVKTYYYNYDIFLDDKYFSLPNLLIATGILVFFIAFFGCCGAIKESVLMLYGFIGLMILIFILEFSAGIAGYVLRDKTIDYLDNKLLEDIKKYNNTYPVTKVWDTIQSKFHCCGVNTANDWKGRFPDGSLPVSCCDIPVGTTNIVSCHLKPEPTKVKREASESGSNAAASPQPTGAAVNATSSGPTAASVGASAVSVPAPAASEAAQEVPPVHMDISHAGAGALSAAVAPGSHPVVKAEDPTETLTTTITELPSLLYYKDGCVYKFGQFVKDHTITIGGVGLAFACIQLLGILFACHLARRLRNNNYYST